MGWILGIVIVFCLLIICTFLLLIFSSNKVDNSKLYKKVSERPFKSCSTCNEDVMDWDFSNVTRIINLSSMNEEQLRYCYNNKLVLELPGMELSAIIDKNIYEEFKNL